jgi:hypothetical protein
MENFASTDSYVQEDFAEAINIIKTFRANLNAIPKNQLGHDVLPQIFKEEYMNNVELTPLKVVPSSNIQNITQEGLYNRIIIKNMITKSMRISNLKIEGSIFHCEFDNIDLSGKYTAQISLTRDKNYNDEYKKIVLDAIPIDSRFTIEQKEPTKLSNIIEANLKDFSSDMNPKNARRVPKVVMFVDCLFNQMNIINDENIPIIFINCSGNVNITMNNGKAITNLRSIACPPPKEPTTKLVGTAVAAVVVTVVIYSAILHFRK